MGMSGVAEAGNLRAESIWLMSSSVEMVSGVMWRNMACAQPGAMTNTSGHVTPLIAGLR